MFILKYELFFFQILTIEKLNALFTVLEAFGNSRTHMNSNATRFSQLFSLDFDQSGQIASASLQVKEVSLFKGETIGVSYYVDDL